MPRWPRVVLVALLLLAGIAFTGWRWLTAPEAVPERSSWTLDLERVRALAAEPPGPRPRAIRSELLAEAELPRAAVFAGEPFAPHTMVHQVFQIVWDDRFLLIDAGFSRAVHEEMGGERPYHQDAWERVQAAMGRAEQIWITHEHADHLEGVARHGAPEALLGRLRLSRSQLANVRRLDEVAFPDLLRRSLEPAAYQEVLAIAPGVVVIGAAGHTPGSQIFFVQLADGREVLLLGDVVWHLDAVRQLHYRPRLVTDFFLNEDRAAVLAQIRTLHELLRREPALRQVPSHDADVREALLVDGVLLDGLSGS